VGSTQDVARNKLRTAKLAPQFQSQESDEPQGQVLATDPEAGTSVAQGSAVTVTISKGPHEVPNVVGLNRSDAIQKIVDAGFKYDIRGDDRSTEPKGTVTDQIPPGGQAQPQGTVITLFVSTYEPPPPPPTETPTETPTTPLPSETGPPPRTAATGASGVRPGPAWRS
jgi:beta-lactam-binding protein with PASTA domain